MGKTIYLLSGGDPFKNILTEEQQTLLKLDLKNKHNLVAIGAKKDYEKNDLYFYGANGSFGTIKTLSFSDLKNFNLIDARTKKEDGLALLKNADVIYLQGGDPFIQLNYLKDNGYDNFLKDYNGIIIGVSAGSMNLSENALYSKDEDYPETHFYKGLGIIDLTIDPHFDIENQERVKEIISASQTHKIIGLPDYSAIKITGDGKIIELGTNYKYENAAQQE